MSDARDIRRPMLATLGSLATTPLHDPRFVYEPKYDGIRAIAEIGRRGRGAFVARLWSRLGNEKTSQFPEIARELERWAASRLKGPAVLDGEIVALDPLGQPVGFQHLQGRMHLHSRRARAGTSATTPAAFIAFDLLLEGRTDLRPRPLVERRAALHRLFAQTGSSLLRLGEQSPGDGRDLYARAQSSGGEGVVAKLADSRYQAGRRTPDWRKLKVTQEQEFVVGGWTDGRGSRSHFGALLLGVYDGGGTQSPVVGRRAAKRALIYAGSVGTGFDERELARVMTRLRTLESDECPFREQPGTDEGSHWVKPQLVAQVRFSEWTADGKLRHPVYLGLRDDKTARHVVSESAAMPSRSTGATKAQDGVRQALDDLVGQLHGLEDAKRDGWLRLPDGQQLKVTNLRKVFWPRRKYTKGDLFRYYVEISPHILPVLADRPLVMKRYPDGVDGEPFYQHQINHAPSVARVERVSANDGRLQLIGGDLPTLLYTAQLAAISQDPWFSRLPSIDQADHAALDLDPSPGTPFARVLDVARWIRDELDTIGAVGFPKTSGADGLHIYVPLPPDTPYEAGQLFCQIIAAIVSAKHPQHATTERMVKARGRRVYIDCLQNAIGKTLASAYSARSSDDAGVSTPLTWAEVDEGVTREDFTIQTVPGRLRTLGDLWAGLRQATGVDLARAIR